MRLSRRLFSSQSKFGLTSITEYYDQRKMLTEKLLNLIDETNSSMSVLYSNPKHITLYNCFNELSRIENTIPEPLLINKNVANDQIDSLTSKISKHKNELLETFRDLENLDVKKQRYLNF